LQVCKLPRKAAVIITFILFIGIMYLILGVLLPAIIKQLGNFLSELPNYANKAQTIVQAKLHNMSFISDEQVQKASDGVKGQLVEASKTVLSSMLVIIPGVFSAIVYFVMVPLLVYFFLMDKAEIITWCKRFIPKHHAALGQVWQEIYVQIGNYVRGKILEAVIIMILSYLAFLLLGLNYPILLAVAIGLSVFIPYIGAVVVTIPVVVMGLIQWGLSPHFIYLVIVYGILITLDGTVLTALLFSKAVSIHPIVIIAATLVFGSLYGFWGVFFAIPLAALFKAVITAWPVRKDDGPAVLQN